MSEVDEEEIIEDYKNNVSQTKILEKYKISAFDLGMILGKHNMEKRIPLKGGRAYPDSVYGVSKSYATVIPKNLRHNFEPGQKLEWAKLGKGEWKLTVIE